MKIVLFLIKKSFSTVSRDIKYTLLFGKKVEVEDYIEELKKKINFKNVFCNYLGTIIGAHTGPGLIAFFYFGKNRL